MTHQQSLERKRKIRNAEKLKRCDCNQRYVNTYRPKPCMGCDRPICDQCYIVAHDQHEGFCNWCVYERQQQRLGLKPVRPAPIDVPLKKRICDAPMVIWNHKRNAFGRTCKNGHPRTPENSINQANGYYKCKLCHRAMVSRGDARRLRQQARQRYYGKGSDESEVTSDE